MFRRFPSLHFVVNKMAVGILWGTAQLSSASSYPLSRNYGTPLRCWNITRCRISCIIIPVIKKLWNSAQMPEHHQMHVSSWLAHRSLSEKHKYDRIERIKYTQNRTARRLSQGAPQGGVASPKKRLEVLDTKSAHGGELIPR